MKLEKELELYRDCALDYRDKLIELGEKDYVDWIEKNIKGDLE